MQSRHTFRGTPTRAVRASGAVTASASGRVRIDMLVAAVMGAILTYVWRAQDLYPILATIKFPIVTSIAAIGLYAMDRTAGRSLRTVRHPITTAVTIVVGFAVLSVPTSLYRGMSFWFIVDDLSKNYLLFLVLVASARSFPDIRRYAAAFVAGAFIYAFYVYRFVSVGISGRLGNIVYYDANDLGMLLVSSIPLSLYFAVRARSMFYRFFSVASIGLYLLVIIKTGSRGAFLGLIAVAVYLLLLFRTVSGKVRILAVVGAAAVLMLKGGEAYWGMMATILHPKDDYNWSGNSEDGRMEIWKRGIGYMLSHPITGVGASAFPIAEGQISPLADRQMLGIGVRWAAAHNAYVQIGAELGVFGIAAFLFMLWTAFQTARDSHGPTDVIEGNQQRRPPPSDEAVLGQALAASVIGYAVTAFFLSQGYAAMLFVLVGMIVALHKVTASNRVVPAAQPQPTSRRRPFRASSSAPEVPDRRVV